MPTIEVKSGDTVWGILKQQFASDQAFNELDPKQQQVAIDYLENKLQVLEQANPEKLRLAGISSLDVDQIQAGEKIDLAKLVGANDWQEAVATAKGAAKAVASQAMPGQPSGVGAAIAEGSAPSTPEEYAKWLKTHPEMRAVLEQTEPRGEGMTTNETALAPASVETVAQTPALDDYRTWLKTNPDMLGKLSSKGGDYLMGIFRTDGVEGNVQYDFTFHGNVFGRVEVAAVLDDYQKLRGNPFTNYDRAMNPLHFSQMDNVAQFSRLSGEAFGDIGKVRPGENIFEYTRRVAALSVRTGKRVGVFN
jgi:hypothetical protein